MNSARFRRYHTAYDLKQGTFSGAGLTGNNQMPEFFLFKADAFQRKCRPSLLPIPDTFKKIILPVFNNMRSFMFRA